MLSNSSVAPESDVPFMDDAAREAAKRVIYFTVFLDLLGFGIVIPLLGVYSTQFGASPAVAGLLAATYSVMGFLFAPFWGRLSDRIGRRPVLLYSIFGTGIGYVIFAFAHSIPALALGMLFLSRIVDGATSGNISTAQAYLSDITPPENRAKAFGMFGAIFGIGFAIGPSLGALIMWLPGVLGLPGSWGTNFGLGLFTAALAFTNWALAWKRLPETLSPDIRRANREKDATQKKRPIINVQGFRQAFRVPGLRLLITLSFFITAAFAMPLQGTYSLFLITKYARPEVQERIKADPQAAIDEARKELGRPEPLELSGGEGAPSAAAIEKTEGGEIAPYPAQMGGDFSLDKPAPPDLSWRHIEKLLVARLASLQSSYIFATIGITAMIVQGGLIGFIRKKLGEVNMIIVGTILMVISLALIPFPKSLPGELPIMALLAAGNSIAAPVLTSLVTALSPENERGELIGVFQSVQSLGRIIGPIVGGALFNYISPNAPYWAGAIVMTMTFFIALQLRGVQTEETLATA